MKRSVHAAVMLLGLSSLLAVAQPLPADPLGPGRAATSPLSEAQLDQLTAPIALYSDPLIGQILTAATYPLEIVEAHRWLQDPANAALSGDQLAAALQQQPWDLSVKSLVPFPQVLQMMDGNLEWTERIGDAFLAQQDAVMDSIQRLRRRAAADGALTSTPQQTVTTAEQEIQIEPANPDVVYVPYYDPNLVYGPWIWPDYPPFVFGLPPGVVIGGGLWIGFGIGFPVLRPYWGWDRWDWRHHHLDCVEAHSCERPGPWQHDPAHRHGVPYRSEVATARFQAQSEASRRDARGYPTGGVRAPGGERVPGGERGQRVPNMEPRETPVPRMAPGARSAPPAFESFGERSQVRSEAARGAASRSAPAPAPRAPPSVPSFHGAGGHGGGHH